MDPLWLLRGGRGLRLWLALVLAGLLAACAVESPLAEAAPQALVGRVTVLMGSVGVTPPGAPSPQPADNRPLAGGERIETAAGARALLRLGSTALRIGPSADVRLGALDERLTVIELGAGSVALRVAAPDWAGRIEFVTPEGRWRAQAPGHYRFDRERAATRATVWAGELRFDVPERTLRVEAGRSVELQPGAVAGDWRLRWSDPAADAFADWVRRDADADDAAQALRHVSPELTGWDELDAWGEWATHPEWGSVWMPRGAGPGWRPYDDGRWAWVMPWGWTWVSSAPWGFATGHYGRWMPWHGRWVWVPGGRAERPRFMPAPPQAPAPRPPVPHPPVPHPPVPHPPPPHVDPRPHPDPRPPAAPPAVPVRPAPPTDRQLPPAPKPAPAAPPPVERPHPAPVERPHPAPGPDAGRSVPAPPAAPPAPVPERPHAPPAPERKAPAPGPKEAPPARAAPPAAPPAQPAPPERQRPERDAAPDAPQRSTDGGGNRGRSPQAAP